MQMYMYVHGLLQICSPLVLRSWNKGTVELQFHTYMQTNLRFTATIFVAQLGYNVKVQTVRQKFIAINGKFFLACMEL